MFPAIDIVRAKGVRRRVGAGLSAARPLYEKAAAGDEVLAAENPWDPRWKRRLALDHSKMGNLAAEAGDLDDAEAYGKALGLAEALMPVVPGVALDAVAVSRGRLAQIADRRGDLDEAREHLEAARVAAQQLVRVAPRDTLAQRGLSIVRTRKASRSANDSRRPTPTS
jgi:tetratricopeptide (TPR) repeat protein